MTLAALEGGGVLEQIPSKLIALIVGSMFAAILFFVKRDYSRINTGIEASAAAIGLLDKKGDERAIAAERRHAELQKEIGECVKHTDMARSMSRVHAKINRNATRVTVLETKAGMHDGHPPPGPDDEPEPGSDPENEA